MPKSIDITDSIGIAEERYGVDGYWPYGTPPPRRLIEGRQVVIPVKEMVIRHFGRIPSHALNTILNNPAFAGVHRSDIVDAISVLDEEVVF